MAKLQNVNVLRTPIDRGLKTLEGQNVTCSDVFFVYIGISIRFMRIFETNQDESTSDMFLFAYFLDPGWLYSESPFNEPCSQLETRLAWWQGRENNNHSDVLALLGVKLFSVSPSEMFNSPRYQHETHETLPKGPLQSAKSQKAYLPTPTLQDLLNPATNVDIESLFANPDPYGIDELTDDDGNESDDNEAEQTPRLIACYNGGAVQESKKSSTLLQKSSGKSAPWVLEKFSMADIDF
ncbi:hypothetical protein IW261DRAFT_1416206 [Armillaria novae-zelandiae]|uniref:Uncharacterized protein n=1 Tax=Armillaria novae-zelandiae TaxID=153914 RepID=A0AA39PMJ8_9AGAR|nr:hypothetical protein IW261DRAFT_1416206 [Armillaria novae-zelandiae]